MSTRRRSTTFLPLRSALEKCDDVGALGREVAEANEALREEVVAFGHQAGPHAEEVEAGKDDRALLIVGDRVAEKLPGHLGPVAGRLEMMADVIAVVEAAAVVRGVDARDAVSIVVL